MKMALLGMLLSLAARAGESALTMTWQPLSTLGAGEVAICRVYCHDWYSHGSMTTAIGLISARNVPPTNFPEQATEDINYASVSGIRFAISDIGSGDEPSMTIDLTKFVKPEGYLGGMENEGILRATLECLRRCLVPELMKTPLELKAAEDVAEWAGPIVREFNKHDRRKEFFRPGR